MRLGSKSNFRSRSPYSVKLHIAYGNTKEPQIVFNAPLLGGVLNLVSAKYIVAEVARLSLLIRLFVHVLFSSRF